MPALLLIAFAPAQAADMGPYPDSEEALNAEYGNLKWIETPGRRNCPSRLAR